MPNPVPCKESFSFPSRLVLYCRWPREEYYADWMADATVSENRLRSASKGVVTSTGLGTAGTYRVKRDEPSTQQWY